MPDLTELVFRGKIRLQQAVETLDPAPLLLRSLPAPRAAIGLISVYRAVNAAHTAALVASLPPGSPIALWALDAVVPGLAAHTVGTGAGGRPALLNRLAASLTLAADDWLIVADDDVSLTRGSPAELIAAAARLGFDLTQPTHDRHSTYTYDHTRHRVLTWGRLVRFIEIGPLVVMGPRARAALLPLPEDGMGWGLELAWAAHEELTLGVVDLVRMRHHGAVGSAYDQTGEQARFDRIVAAAGGLEESMRERGRWRAWARNRPWPGRTAEVTGQE